MVPAPVHTDEGGFEEGSTESRKAPGLSVVVNSAGKLRWRDYQRRSQYGASERERDVDCDRFCDRSVESKSEVETSRGSW